MKKIKTILYTRKNWSNDGPAMGEFDTQEEAKAVAMAEIRARFPNKSQEWAMHLACDYVFAYQNKE